MQFNLIWKETNIDCFDEIMFRIFHAQTFISSKLEKLFYDKSISITRQSPQISSGLWRRRMCRALSSILNHHFFQIQY